MVHAAKALALTGPDLATSSSLLAKAKAEWEVAMAEEPYVCPIPEHVMPGNTSSAR
jgi:aminobenzoyl-glutamate utilization protein B